MKKLAFLSFCFFFIWNLQAQDSLSYRSIVGGGLSFNYDRTESPFMEEGETLYNWRGFFSFSPYHIWQVSDRIGVGVGANYFVSSSKQYNIGLMGGDALWTSNTTHGINGQLLLRYDLVQFKRFQGFLQPYLSGGYRFGSFQIEGEMPDPSSPNWNLALGIQPGIAIQVTDHFWLVGFLGSVSFAVDQTRDNSTMEWSDLGTAVNANFRLNSVGLSLEYRW